MTHTIKLIVVGGQKSGKTTLMRCYMDTPIPDSYVTTTTSDLYNKATVCHDTNVMVTMWDRSGRFSTEDIHSVYYNKADMAILLYCPGELDRAKDWLQSLRTDAPADIPIMLVANSPQALTECDIQAGKAFASGNNLIFAMVNAKLSSSVSNLFDQVLATAWENQEAHGKTPQIFSVDTPEQVRAAHNSVVQFCKNSAFWAPKTHSGQKYPTGVSKIYRSLCFSATFGRKPDRELHFIKRIARGRLSLTQPQRDEVTKTFYQLVRDAHSMVELDQHIQTLRSP